MRADPLSQPDLSVATENFFGLVRRELVEPLRHFSVLAGTIEDLRKAGVMTLTPTAEAMFHEVADLARETSETARRVTDLAELLGEDALDADDRVMMEELLRTACQNNRVVLEARGFGVDLELLDPELAPVYGSRRWLQLAFDELLARLMEATPGNAHISLGLRQIGGHQLLGAVTSIAPPAGRQQILLPQVKKTVVGVRMPAYGKHLSLSLVRRIIETHHGTIKTHLDECGTLVRFTLSMPTGAPRARLQGRNCEACMASQQAERYAEELGELIGQLRSKKGKSK